MKSILFAAVVSFGLFAGACPNPEAQFIAKVESVKPTAVAGRCQVKLSQVEMWNENPLCPLGAEEAFSTTPIITDKCEYKAGDSASGYMVLRDSGVLTF